MNCNLSPLLNSFLMKMLKIQKKEWCLCVCAHLCVCVCLMKATSVTSALMCRVSVRQKPFTFLTRLFCLMSHTLSLCHEGAHRRKCGFIIIIITIRNYFILLFYKFEEILDFYSRFANHQCANYSFLDILRGINLK